MEAFRFLMRFAAQGGKIKVKSIFTAQFCPDAFNAGNIKGTVPYKCSVRITLNANFKIDL